MDLNSSFQGFRWSHYALSPISHELTCKLCGTPYSNTQLLIDHLQSYEHDMAHPCPYCCIDHLRGSELQKHVPYCSQAPKNAKEKQMKDAYKTVFCNLCNKSIISSMAINDMAWQETESRCQLCAKATGQSIIKPVKEMRNHVLEMHGSTICHMCFTDFAQDEDADTHVQKCETRKCRYEILAKHTKESHPMKCPECGVNADPEYSHVIIQFLQECIIGKI